MIAECFDKLCLDSVVVPPGSIPVAHCLCPQPPSPSAIMCAILLKVMQSLAILLQITIGLVILMCEAMKSLAILLEALAAAGLSQPLDGEAYGHVREGLHGVRRMVNMVTEHLKTWSGASGSQGPLPRPPTPAMVIPAAPAADVPLVPEPIVDPDIVFMTVANENSKGGKYHTFEDCPGLRNAMSEVKAHDLETLLAVPRHKFQLCLVCKNRAI